MLCFWLGWYQGRFSVYIFSQAILSLSIQLKILKREPIIQISLKKRLFLLFQIKFVIHLIIDNAK